jgi:hypothetical protein
MQLSNASALLPPHCVAIAPLLKDARDGLDESGSLKFLQLLSSLCLLPAFVAQAQCSAAGFPTQANTCDVFLLCDAPLQRSRSCCPSTRTGTQSSVKLPPQLL